MDPRFFDSRPNYRLAPPSESEENGEGEEDDDESEASSETSNERHHHQHHQQQPAVPGRSLPPSGPLHLSRRLDRQRRGGGPTTPAPTVPSHLRTASRPPSPPRTTGGPALPCPSCPSRYPADLSGLPASIPISISPRLGVVAPQVPLESQPDLGRPGPPHHRLQAQAFGFSTPPCPGAQAMGPSTPRDSCPGPGAQARGLTPPAGLRIGVLTPRRLQVQQPQPLQPLPGSWFQGASRPNSCSPRLVNSARVPAPAPAPATPQRSPRGSAAPSVLVTQPEYPRPAPFLDASSTTAPHSARSFAPGPDAPPPSSAQRPVVWQGVPQQQQQQRQQLQQQQQPRRPSLPCLLASRSPQLPKPDLEQHPSSTMHSVFDQSATATSTTSCAGFANQASSQTRVLEQGPLTPLATSYGQRLSGPAVAPRKEQQPLTTSYGQCPSEPSGEQGRPLHTSYGHCFRPTEQPASSSQSCGMNQLASADFLQQPTWSQQARFQVSNEAGHRQPHPQYQQQQEQQQLHRQEVAVEVLSSTGCFVPSEDIRRMFTTGQAYMPDRAFQQTTLAASCASLVASAASASASAASAAAPSCSCCSCSSVQTAPPTTNYPAAAARAAASQAPSSEHNGSKPASLTCSAAACPSPRSQLKSCFSTFAAPVAVETASAVASVLSPAPRPRKLGSAQAAPSLEAGAPQRSTSYGSMISDKPGSIKAGSVSTKATGSSLMTRAPSNASCGSYWGESQRRGGAGQIVFDTFGNTSGSKMCSDAGSVTNDDNANNSRSSNPNINDNNDADCTTNNNNNNSSSSSSCNNNNNNNGNNNNHNTSGGDSNELWEVRLHRNCDEQDGILGLSLTILGQGPSSILAVQDVLDRGAVRAWNAANRSKSVRPGDLLEEVNGLRGAPSELLQIIQDSVSLTILLRRPLVC